jgi:hypothetical protein
MAEAFVARGEQLPPHAALADLIACALAVAIVSNEALSRKR